MTSLPTPAAGNAVRMDAGSTLCTACGLCCTGLLYGNVSLFPEDLPRLERHPLPVLQDEVRGMRFLLPCPYHQENRCGIYEHRFTICRTFECELLQRVEQGKRSPDEAMAVVEQAHQLVGQLHRDLGCDPAGQKLSRAIAEKLTEVQARPASSLSASEARFLLHVRMLWMLFARHFDRRMAERLGGEDGVLKPTSPVMTPAAVSG